MLRSDDELEMTAGSTEADGPLILGAGKDHGTQAATDTEPRPQVPNKHNRSVE